MLRWFQDTVRDLTWMEIEQVLGLSVLQGIPYYITVFLYGVLVLYLLVLLFDFLLFVGRLFSGEQHVEHPTKKTTRRVFHVSVGTKALVFLLIQLPAAYGLIRPQALPESLQIEHVSLEQLFHMELPFFALVLLVVLNVLLSLYHEGVHVEVDEHVTVEGEAHTPEEG